jgi:hypothetical protein
MSRYWKLTLTGAAVLTITAKGGDHLEISTAGDFSYQRSILSLSLTLSSLTPFSLVFLTAVTDFR